MSLASKRWRLHEDALGKDVSFTSGTDRRFAAPCGDVFEVTLHALQASKSSTASMQFRTQNDRGCPANQNARAQRSKVKRLSIPKDIDARRHPTLTRLLRNEFFEKSTTYPMGSLMRAVFVLVMDERLTPRDRSARRATIGTLGCAAVA